MIHVCKIQILEQIWAFPVRQEEEWLPHKKIYDDNPSLTDK